MLQAASHKLQAPSSAHPVIQNAEQRSEESVCFKPQAASHKLQAPSSAHRVIQNAEQRSEESEWFMLYSRLDRDTVSSHGMTVVVCCWRKSQPIAVTPCNDTGSLSSELVPIVSNPLKPHFTTSRPDFRTYRGNCTTARRSLTTVR
jgi:hypothetical protein